MHGFPTFKQTYICYIPCLLGQRWQDQNGRQKLYSGGGTPLLMASAM